MKLLAYITIGIIAVWGLATLWVQYSGTGNWLTIGDTTTDKHALIVYNPDPIYNLDEQICIAFAEGLAENGCRSTIATLNKLPSANIDHNLLVVCANTYNWAPDWGIREFIRKRPELEGSSVVAITLGSGSTSRSKRLLEGELARRKVNLLGSESYWLLRPNDENRMTERNVDVAVDMARKYGAAIGRKFTGSNF